MSEAIFRIAIPVPLRQLFDYLPPIEPLEPLAVKLEPGMRVLVPFGRRTIVGIIIEIRDSTDHPVLKLKRIIACLDKEALFPKTILQLDLQQKLDFFMIYCQLNEILN